MTQLDNYRIIFITIGLMGILLFAWPTIGIVIKSPAGEKFSELYILGSNRTLDNIPFNVKAGVTHSIYLGVGNHMGSPIYYTSIVKLRNETEPLPNSVLGTPSLLPSIYEYKSFLQDEGRFEAPFTFQIKNLTFVNGLSYLATITINGLDFPVNKASVWDSNKTGYYYNLLVELWIFNSTLGLSQYHNRYVNLVFNMTK
jgi:hypothetical protein